MEGKKLSQLTEAELAEIVQLYRDGLPTVKIQTRYNVKHGSTVSTIAKRAGVQLRLSRRVGTRSSERAPGQFLDRRIEVLEAQLIELRERKALQAIRFEIQDDTTVIVHGVTESFVRSGGIPRLLQFIEKKIPQRSFMGARNEGAS